MSKMSRKRDNRPRTISHYRRGLGSARIVYITSGEDEIRRLFDTLNLKVSRITILGFTERNQVVSYSCYNGALRIRKFRIPVSLRQRSISKYLAHLITFIVYPWILVSSGSIRCDIAICTGAMDAFIMAPFRRLGLVKRLVYFNGDYFPSSGRITRVERFASSVYNSVNEISMRQADGIWCYTIAIKEKVPSHIRSSKFVDVMPPLYFPVGDSRPDTKNPVVVYLGAFKRETGIGLVLEAFSRLSHTDPKPVLHLFGIPSNAEVIPEIMKRASSLGVEGQLVIRGFAELEDLASTVQRAICGLAVFPGGGRNYSNYAYPSKVKTKLENGIVT